MYFKKNSPGCNCCKVECILLNDTFARSSSAVGDDYEQVSGTWFIDPVDSMGTTGNLKTTDADAIILWNGTYRPSVGVAIDVNTTFAYDKCRIYFDWKDANNCHYVRINNFLTAPVGSTTPSVVNRRLRVYKRTSGTDNLLHDASLSGNVGGLLRAYGNVITVGSSVVPTTFHNGKRAGLGTDSDATSATFPQFGIRHMGTDTGCISPVTSCDSCFFTDGQYDMALTLKMNSACSGGALAETTYIMPFAGSTPGGSSGSCYWFMDASDGIPCGWTWMYLWRLGPTVTPAEFIGGVTGFFWKLEILGWGGLSSGLATLYFLIDETGSPVNIDCSTDAYAMLEREVGGVPQGHTFYIANGTNTPDFAGVFDISVSKVQRA